MSTPASVCLKDIAPWPLQGTTAGDRCVFAAGAWLLLLGATGAAANPTAAAAHGAECGLWCAAGGGIWAAAADLLRGADATLSKGADRAAAVASWLWTWVVRVDAGRAASHPGGEGIVVTRGAWAGHPSPLPVSFWRLSPYAAQPMSLLGARLCEHEPAAVEDDGGLGCCVSSTPGADEHTGA